MYIYVYIVADGQVIYLRKDTKVRNDVPSIFDTVIYMLLYNIFFLLSRGFYGIKIVLSFGINFVVCFLWYKNCRVRFGTLIAV